MQQSIQVKFAQYLIYLLDSIFQSEIRLFSYYYTMDQIPSHSISKSILLVTPLFLLVLAVLHSSSELSYLFILKFINNVAGSADITVMPTLQPQVSHQKFVRDDLLNQFELYEGPQSSMQGTKIPLVNIKSLQKWAEKNDLVQGISPRWLIPTKIGKTDCLLLIVNVTQQKSIGMIKQQIIPKLDGRQIVMQQMLTIKLGYEKGDVVPISLKPKNFLNGLKLFQKFSDESSDQQYKPESSQELMSDQISEMLFKIINPYSNGSVSQQDVKKIVGILYDSQGKYEYTLKQSFYPEGIYPSALSNVVIMQYDGFINLLSKWIISTFLKITQQQTQIKKLIPPQYQRFLPKSELQAQLFGLQARPQLQALFQAYSLMSVCRLKSREQIYNPYKGQTYNKFTEMLENVPGNIEMVVIYPFFSQSLAIKFFFDSVIQIFQFVTCIVYFYTMTLIMKQIYEEKEIQVGIWRTLGAGGVSQRKQTKYQIQMQEKSVVSRGSGIKYSSQFQQKISLKQKLKFASKLALKVGYLNYWLITISLSIVLYFTLKLIFYYLICKNLGFSVISQPPINLPLLFISISMFVCILVYSHIHRIYTNPLSQTIKPVKRTFDMVKVRVIHVATFGVSLEVLLIAIMLVYYGVVSYYWIPFAVLDGQEDLQVLLFNTIFLFMIFGAIMLLSILQSRIEVAIFSVIFRFSKQMRTMKLAILKNIKAKQYKNIKVAVIISIIFAFVLFFTAGIKIQMQIVQSFIERSLGSNLVFQNYQKVTFKNQPINQFLQSQPQLQYSWLSRSLSRDNVSISLTSHITNRKLTPQLQVLTSNYLNSTFYQYYYPQQYLPQYKQYSQLPNSIYDGFNSIYKGQKGAESVGKFNPDDTITKSDPFSVIIDRQTDPAIVDFFAKALMAPEEQIVNLVVSSGLRKQLGVQVGDLYKMKFQNPANSLSYSCRARITHTFKAGPGFDLLGEKAFMSEQQAAYIYRILGVKDGISKQNEKLFIKGSKQNLKGIGSAIIPMSPQHTQMFQIEFVSQSFSLLSKFLSGYIVLITMIMSALVTIFIFLYTLGKCREEAEMYKMLRAIGLSARNIRIMIFAQIIIRLVVSILNGIFLGVVFSIGFSLQIQEFLMIKTPPMDITLVCVIGIVLTVIFSFTIMRATSYISQKSVADTNRI